MLHLCLVDKDRSYSPARAVDFVLIVNDVLQISGQASYVYRELVRELYNFEYILLREKEADGSGEKEEKD